MTIAVGSSVELNTNRTEWQKHGRPYRANAGAVPKFNCQAKWFETSCYCRAKLKCLNSREFSSTRNTDMHALRTYCHVLIEESHSDLKNTPLVMVLTSEHFTSLPFQNASVFNTRE